MADFLGKEYYIIYKYIIYFLKVFFEGKALPYLPVEGRRMARKLASFIAHAWSIHKEKDAS